jgi:hypothetical protein
LTVKPVFHAAIKNDESRTFYDKLRTFCNKAYPIFVLLKPLKILRFMKHLNLNFFALLLAVFMTAPLSADNIYVTYEQLAPSKDTYVQLNTSTNLRGGEGSVYVKYNGADITSQRDGLYEFDFTPYLDKLSQIKSLTLNLGVYNYNLTTPDNEPEDLMLHVYKIPAIAGFTIDESATNAVLYTAYQAIDENDLIELGSIPIPTNKANTTFMYRTISLNLSNVLSSVSTSNPKVSFCVKAAASKAQGSTCSFESKESANEHLKSYLQVKLESPTPYDVTTVSLEKDTYYQNDGNVATVFGSNDLLLLKGYENTQSSRRYAIIQFDFTSYSNILATSEAVNLGFNTDFTGDNGGNDSTLLIVCGVPNVNFTEAMTNAEVKTAYENVKANEVILTNKTVSSVNGLPATDYICTPDKTKLLSLISTSPVVNFVVKSTNSPGGFLQIASKEHATRTHPFIQILNPGTSTQLNPAGNNDDTITETRYYTLQGVEVQKPVPGNMYIVKKVYASKKSEITKSFVR